jgi:hypothetical protein
LKLYLFIILILTNITTYAAEFSDYMYFKGYEVESKVGYSIISSYGFQDIGTDSALWIKDNVIDGDGDQNVVKWIAHTRKRFTVDMYDASLAPILIERVPLNFNKIEKIRTNSDVVFVVRQGEVIMGGLIILHCFSKKSLGTYFYQSRYLEFSGQMMQQLMATVPKVIRDKKLLH